MTKPKCFVASPFSGPDTVDRAWSDCLLENIIELAIGDQYEVTRTIDSPEAGNIVDRIMRDLEEADMVIGDITGSNANVFYELGFRAARGLPAVLVCRSDSQPRADAAVPFVLSTFEAIRIEAAYDSVRGRYLLGEAAKAISDLRSQVGKAVKKQRPPELVHQGAYRVRVFKWRTRYSITIATDWLEAQVPEVKALIDDYENGTRRPVAGDLLRALAEYLELKAAANQTMDGTAVYFVNTLTNDVDLGYGIYNFPNQVVVISLGGREDRQAGTAAVTFDQPGRHVSVGDVRAELPSYSFSVEFTRHSPTTLVGVIKHPVTSTTIGSAELISKMGFKF